MKKRSIFKTNAALALAVSMIITAGAPAVYAEDEIDFSSFEDAGTFADDLHGDEGIEDAFEEMPAFSEEEPVPADEAPVLYEDGGDLYFPQEEIAAEDAAAESAERIYVSMDEGIESVTIAFTEGYKTKTTVEGSGYVMLPLGYKAAVTAVPKDGYAVKQISMGGSDVITATTSISVTSEASKIRLSLSYTVGATAAPTCNKNTDLSYDPGTSMTVTAADAAAGYAFAGWYEGEKKVGSEKVFTFSLKASATLTAKYNKIITVSVADDTAEYGVTYKPDNNIVMIEDADRSLLDTSKLTVIVADGYSASSAVGSKYAMKPSGLAIKSGVTGYEIEYRPGTLTVVSSAAVEVFLADVKALPESAKAAASDRTAVDKAKTDYGKLVDIQKDMLEVKTAYLKLGEVEAAVKRAEEVEALEKAVRLIGEIPEKITPDSRTAIEAARAAYNALTESQKKNFNAETYRKLTAAEQEIVQADADKGESARIIEILKAMTSEEESVRNAQRAYETLTPGEQYYIPEELVKTLNEYVAYYDAKDNKKAADEFAAAVNAIPESKAGEGKALTDAAVALGTALTNEQAALVKPEVMDTYYEAIAAYAEGRQFQSGSAWYKVLHSGDVMYWKPVSKDITTAVVPGQVRKGKYYFKVTRISINAFNGCVNMKWVKVGKNITAIGKLAFKNTPNLGRINILGTEVASAASAFNGAGKKGKLTVIVPESKLEEYTEMFTGDGKLKGSVTAA